MVNKANLLDHRPGSRLIFHAGLWLELGPVLHSNRRKMLCGIPGKPLADQLPSVPLSLRPRLAFLREVHHVLEAGGGAETYAG